MYDYTGWIVEAAAGRDKGGVFCVVGVDQERSMLLLADGKRRKVAIPRSKSWAMCSLSLIWSIHLTTRPSKG